MLESPEGPKVSARKGFLAEFPQRKRSPCATCIISNLERSKRKTCVCAQKVSSLPWPSSWQQWQRKKQELAKRFLTAFTAARRTHRKHNTSATEDIKHMSQHRADAAWMLAKNKKIVGKSIKFKHRSVTHLKTDYDDGRFDHCCRHRFSPEI